MTSEGNRERIVEAALLLFTTRGYADTSIGDIAQQAGVLKGNLSYYFATKADLLVAVAEALRDRYLSGFAAAAGDAAGLAPIAAFLDFVAASAPHLARHGCPIGGLCSELGKDAPQLQSAASTALAAVRDWLTEVFARRINDKSAAEHAEMLLAMMQGAALMSHAFNDEGIVLRQVAAARRWVAEVEACQPLQT